MADLPCFCAPGNGVKVDDLLRGIIVLSGNDACAVIAEALSPNGTEAEFARHMTQRAKQLGMQNSSFANSNGWPDPNQRMSMRDLGIITDRIITEFPEFYSMFSEKEFVFDENESQNRYNRNPLLGLGLGARRAENWPYKRGRVRPREVRPSRAIEGLYLYFQA